MDKYRVEYSSNNSGGYWWLDDNDWQTLADAGWDVQWDNFLGAKASHASKIFEARTEDSAINKAINEWEDLTGENQSDEGCECCGPPHNFYANKL